MRKNFYKSLLVMAVVSVFVAVTLAQDTKTEVVRNWDGSYSVIEYPVGKEVSVTLLPGSMVPGAKGMARVMRSSDGSKVYVDVSGVPADTKTYYAYAVDASGVPSLLGPVTFENGIAKSEFSTPMNQFMVVLSPSEALTAVDPASTVFWSEAPKGYAIVPRVKVSDTKIHATSTEVSSTYEVPLLNVPSFGKKTHNVKINFTGDLQGLIGKASINAAKGKSKITMRFNEMGKVPANKRFILWAASPDGKYTKLGQVVNTGRNDESEIKSETALADFGLFVTLEDTDVTVPTSKIYSVFGNN